MDTLFYTNRAKVKRAYCTNRSLLCDAVGSYSSDMGTREEIGRRIKLARERAGMKLREVCEQVPSLTTSKLGNYERGERMPDFDMLKQIAKATGVSASYLATFDDEMIDPRERALIECFRQSDERGKSAITRIAEAELQMSASVDHEHAECG